MTTLYTTTPRDTKVIADAAEFTQKAFLGMNYVLGYNVFSETPDEAYDGSVNGRESKLIKIEITEVQQ